MAELHSRFIREVWSPDGPQADIELFDDVTARREFRCLCHKNGGTDIGGDGPTLLDLNNRHSPQTVCFVARMTTLYGGTYENRDDSR